MDTARILSILREHAPELKSAGVVHLRIFGSVVRGEASEESDVDLLVDFDESKRMTLVSVAKLQRRLSDLLGKRVDLSASAWLKEPVREHALGEAVIAF